MTQLIHIGSEMGVTIPPDLISAAHLDTGPLSLEVTKYGLLIRPTAELAKLFDYDPDDDAALWDETDEQDLAWPKS